MTTPLRKRWDDPTPEGARRRKNWGAYVQQRRRDFRSEKEWNEHDPGGYSEDPDERERKEEKEAQARMVAEFVKRMR